MPTTKEVIDALLTDLPKISRPDYLTDIYGGIKYGPYLTNSFNQRPAISFLAIEEITEHETMDSRELLVQFKLRGYTDSSYEAIELASDLRKFLYSTDWTYRDETELYEGSGVTLEPVKYYGRVDANGEPISTTLVLSFLVSCSENF